MWLCLILANLVEGLKFVLVLVFVFVFVFVYGDDEKADNVLVVGYCVRADG